MQIKAICRISMRHSLRFILLFLLFTTFLANAQDLKSIPGLNNKRVVDETGTFSASQIESMNQQLAEFEREKGSQIVVLFVKTTEPEAIEQYSIRVAEQWEIGRKGVDDGVIIIVAKNDRRMRIEVGYGLEGAIPDAYANRIINEIMKPEFRAGDFYQGVAKAIDAIEGLINGEDLPEPTHVSKRRPDDWNILGLLMPVALVFAGVGGHFLKKKFGKTKGRIIFFVIVFIIGGLIVGFILSFIISIILTFAFGGSSGRRGGGGGWFIGGSGGGFGGGGGFSGGGGGFGGGGASGGW